MSILPWEEANAKHDARHKSDLNAEVAQTLPARVIYSAYGNGLKSTDEISCLGKEIPAGLIHSMCGCRSPGVKISAWFCKMKPLFGDVRGRLSWWDDGGMLWGCPPARQSSSLCWGHKQPPDTQLVSWGDSRVSPRLGCEHLEWGELRLCEGYP